MTEKPLFKDYDWTLKEFLIFMLMLAGFVVFAAVFIYAVILLTR